MYFYINLRHLRAFIVVAELGSVSKASEKLFTAQSAVTRSIHELELALGVQLFERKANGMLCTTFAHAVLFRARRAMQELAQGFDEIRNGSKRARNAQQSHIPLILYNNRRLDAFIKLADSGHMPTVAKALGISQPAVSGSINDLESNLGLVLFRRTSKGMITTEAGEMLAFRVKRALAELRHVKTDLSALLGTTEGRVVIGALPLGRTAILPLAISEVLAQFPSLRFSTVEGAFDKLAADLRSGDIDFIFGALRPADYALDLTTEALLSDLMAVVVRTGHPLTQYVRITLEDLMGFQWVLSRPGTPSRTLFDLSFTSQNLQPPSECVETSDLAILRGLLLNTDIVTAISAGQLQYEIAAGVLKVLDIALPNTCRAIGITMRAESHPSPGATVLMEAIRRVAADVTHVNSAEQWS